MLGQNIDIIVLRLKLLAQLGTSIKLEEMYYIILKNYIYILNIYVFVLFLLGVLNTTHKDIYIYIMMIKTLVLFCNICMMQFSYEL
jgi:hypothetical protein